MIFGAFKRTAAVELVSYLVCALGVLLLALLLPGLVSLPDWLVLVVLIGVQLWLYKRFYGRL